MNNNEQNQDGRDEHNQDGKEKKKIPLWLQGLEEQQAEEAFNEELTSEAEDAQPEVDWVQETTGETELPSSGFEELDASPPDSQLFDTDKTKAVSTDDLAGIESDFPEPQPFDEGFTEFPDIELPEEHELIQDIEEEMIPEDEDLPDWLHEMIAEEPEQLPEEVILPAIEIEEEEVTTEEEVVVDEEEKEEKEEEPTEPVKITYETPAETSAILTEPEIEIPPQEVVEEIVEVEMEVEAEEQEEQYPPIPIQEDIPESEEVQIPKTLRFAKFLLDQGDYPQAMEIIETYTVKSEYGEKIKEWLQEAVEEGAGLNSAIWESLGDIALSEGNPEQAFAAYTKAIDILLKSPQDHHEND